MPQGTSPACHATPYAAASAGRRSVGTRPAAAGYADDDPAQAGQLPLVVVPVAEPKRSKNRVHLDLASTSDDHKGALVARLEGLGARQIDIGQPDDASWVVLADPEGNEFCVVSHLGSVGKDPASTFAGIGPVAAVVFDCMDPEVIAPFWAAATGWPVLGRDDQGVWLRDDQGGGPYLDLHRVSEPKTAKLRVHLASHPSPTTTTAPRSHGSARSAPSRSTSAKATSTGSCLPTPRATSSASSPLADRTGGEQVLSGLPGGHRALGPLATGRQGLLLGIRSRSASRHVAVSAG